MPDALQLLRDDHQKVKELFKEFENADDATTRKRIADTVIRELEVHTMIEEEIFYPVVRRQQGDTSEMMNEATEEHHVADLLIAELRDMPASNKQFAAKFTVLAENVKHHIQEEESEMLPKAAELGGDRLGPLGEQMERRKMELMAEPQTRARKKASTRKTAARGAAGRSSTTGRRTAAGRTTAARKATTGRATTARKATGRKPAARKSTTGRKAATVRTATRRAATGTRRATTRAAAATRTAVSRTARAAASRSTRATPKRARKTATRRK